MNITAAQVKEIRLALAKMKPIKVTLDGNRDLTMKEAIFALAPTLERMKKRGFDTQEIVEKLHEKGIEVKPPTLAKYLNEFRRGKDRKTDTPPPPVKAEKTALTQQPDRPATVSRGGLSLRRTRRWMSYSRGRYGFRYHIVKCPPEILGPLLHLDRGFGVYAYSVLIFPWTTAAPP